jgi:TonB family protein
MERRVLAASLFAFASVWAQQPPAQGVKLAAANAVSEITVERKGCFGSCPFYTFTLRRQGTSVYIGNRRSGGSGHYSAERVADGEFDRLSKAITDFGFFDLADQYGPVAEDIEKVIVTVSTAFRSKSITIYDPSHAPFSLWAVLTLADGVAANLDWEDSENARLGFRLPSPISQTRPEYTGQARAAKLEGSVQVYVEVQADGATSPEHMMVAHGLGMGLDKKAIEAVSKWKFKPAQINGRPVSWVTNVWVDFRLEGSPAVR